MSSQHSPILSPSILSCDFGRMAEDCTRVLSSGAQWLHVDVMDGNFVPNISIGLPILSALRKHFPSTFLDVHLMIDEPIRYIDVFRNAGADLITVHVEACTHLHRTLQAIRSSGAHVGLSLNPGTPLDVLEPVLEDLDLILLMSVNPGFGGQSLIPSIYRRVKHVRSLIDALDKPLWLEVDGGVKVSNIEAIHKAGADVFVAGSAVFGHPSGPERGVVELLKMLNVSP